MISAYYIFQTANVEEDYGLRSLGAIKFSLEEVCAYQPPFLFDSEVWQVFNQDTDAHRPMMPRLAARWHGSLGWLFEERFQSDLCDESRHIILRYARDAAERIAQRLEKRSVEYEFQSYGRVSHDRWMLHQTFSMELDAGGLLEGEDAERLEFESYSPGDPSMALPEYFANVARDDRPKYITYTAQEFTHYRLFKAKGLRAGFALKAHPEGWDVVYVHNNSGQLGLGRPLLDHAIANGGNMLDHFDGYLSLAYAKHFPKVDHIVAWDEECAPKWRYQPVEMEHSIWAEKHRQMGDYPDEELNRARENYAQGKPHIIYRRTNAQSPCVKRG